MTGWLPSKLLCYDIYDLRKRAAETGNMSFWNDDRKIYQHAKSTRINKDEIHSHHDECAVLLIFTEKLRHPTQSYRQNRYNIFLEMGRYGSIYVLLK